MKRFNLLFLLALIFGAAFVAVEAQTKQTGERKFGFLERFEKAASGGYQIKMDYAELFEGDQAEREAKKDGEPSPADTSGIYIRNKNPKIHTERVAANAQVFALKNIEPYKLTLANFDLLRAGKLKDADKFWGFPSQYGAAGVEPMPCYVTIKNGAVVKIEQVYFP